MICRVGTSELTDDPEDGGTAACLFERRLNDEEEQLFVTENMESCKTIIGTVKVSRDLPYPCDPEPEIAEETGQIRRIVTASHRFRLHDVPIASSEVP